MDITLLRTFLAVADSGSFVSASEQLFVTQSAVSLRVQRLEESLGKPLFVRSKAGAELTPAGLAFERYALSLMRSWEEARQQVGIPPGFTRSLSIGAQYSIWPWLGFGWMDGLRAAAPDLSLKAEAGMPDRLTRLLVEGAVDVALQYRPTVRPGLRVTPVVEEELVLVASWPNPTLELEHGYVLVDWGPEFIHAQAREFPDRLNTGITLSVGALALDYILQRRSSAYLPARHVKPYVDAGTLHMVPDAGVFPYPVWAVWREDIEPILADVAEMTLAAAAESVMAGQGEMEEKLRLLSKNNELKELYRPDLFSNKRKS